MSFPTTLIEEVFGIVTPFLVKAMVKFDGEEIVPEGIET